jgi:predicted oxidoreductase
MSVVWSLTGGKADFARTSSNRRKLNIQTRKTLGGFETDLDSRLFGSDGKIMPGLYAVGEAAGFGGGMHGYRSLEGTFLGGCLFSGRNAGRAAAKAVG